MFIQFLVLSISDDILQFLLMCYLNGMSKKIFFFFVKCLFYSSYLSITHVNFFFVSLFTSFVEISMLFEALLNKSIGSK
jgi:hypothetical protein